MSKTPKTSPVLSVPLGKIVPNPLNPRGDLDPVKLQDLAISLLRMGQLQPGVAREHPKKAGKYELLAGHRRWQALQAAGLREMLLIVRELDDRQALEVMVSENLHREDLTALEEAAGVKTLLDIGKDIKAIAADLGKSVGWVARRAKLAELHPGLRALVNDPKHALSDATVETLELIAIQPQAVQEQWAKSDEDSPWAYGTTPTVQGMQHRLGLESRELRRAAWALDNPLLLPKAGACLTCVKRTGCQADLFDDLPGVTKEDACLDAACWQAKSEANHAAKLAVVMDKHADTLKVCTDREAAPAAAKKTGALQPGDFEVVRKGTTGAVKAVDVSPAGVGKTVWVLPAKPVHATPAAPQGKQPRTVEQKRMDLDCRREALAMERLGKYLVESESAVPQDAEVLVKLTALFGTARREDGTTGFHALSHAHPDVDVTAIETDWKLRAWENLAPVLQRRLRVEKVTRIPRAQQVEAEWFASLVGLNWPDLFRAAVEDLPEPKSWAAQERAEQAETVSPVPADGLPADYETRSTEGKAEALNTAFVDSMEGNPLTASSGGNRKAKGKAYYPLGAATGEADGAAEKPANDFAGGWSPEEYAAMEASGIGMKAWKRLDKRDRETLIAEHREQQRKAVGA